MVVNYFPSLRKYLQLLLYSRPRYPSSLAMFSNAALSFGAFHVFYPRGCIKFNPDSCCHLDSKVPLANEHRNCWVDRVSYHIHLHSTDSDNTVLLSEKEHCTHGTLCSFPSVDIWVIAPLQPVWILVTSFSYPQRMFTPSMITSFTKSCAQATLVENCFSTLGNKYSTVARNIRQPTAI